MPPPEENSCTKRQNPDSVNDARPAEPRPGSARHRPKRLFCCCCRTCLIKQLWSLQREHTVAARIELQIELEHLANYVSLRRTVSAEELQIEPIRMMMLLRAEHTKALVSAISAFKNSNTPASALLVKTTCTCKQSRTIWLGYHLATGPEIKPTIGERLPFLWTHVWVHDATATEVIVHFSNVGKSRFQKIYSLCTNLDTSSEKIEVEIRARNFHFHYSAGLLVASQHAQRTPNSGLRRRALSMSSISRMPCCIANNGS